MDQYYFTVPFAALGDQTVPPLTIQSSGSISMQQGWGPDYALDPSTNPSALPIDRATTNWLLYAITQAVAALQQTGIPQWITPANNNGVAFPYAKYSTVRYSSTVPGVTFNTYVSVIDNNTDTPGATANWQPIASIVAAASDVIAGTSSALPVTPLTLKSYPGNVAQTFAVAPATAGTMAPQLQQMTGRLLNIQRFTSGTATYTPTAGTTNVRITVVGGGASGGGAAATSSGQFAVGGGGGGGAAAIGYYAVASVTGLLVTVGAGGAAASSGGNNGGTSSVGTLITASGGLGGSPAPAVSNAAMQAGGSGGTTFTGGNITGGLGGPGGNGVGFTTGNFVSGAGGASIFSLGAPSVVTSTNHGNSGSGPGCGGGAAASNAGGTAQASGAGNNGIVIIEEFA